MNRARTERPATAATGPGTAAEASTAAESVHGTETEAGTEAGRDGRRPRRPAARRLETDPEQVEHDLVCLVLTLVELIRQLMERQAMRRVEGDDLAEDQVERVGLALMRLDEAMTRLKEHFEISDDELNLDLGPLGSLLPVED